MDMQQLAETIVKEIDTVQGVDNMMAQAAQRDLAEPWQVIQHAMARCIEDHPNGIPVRALIDHMHAKLLDLGHNPRVRL